MTSAPKLLVSEATYLATMTGERPAFEFVNGEVIQKPLTKRDHNDVARALNRLFVRYEAETGGYWCWEATTNVSRGTDRRYRVPDMAYWAPERPVSQPDDVYLPPTLAIEVRSQGQRMGELQAKCGEYLDRGVELCWLIDPKARTVEVFDGDGATTRTAEESLAHQALPGLAIRVSDLW